MLNIKPTPPIDDQAVAEDQPAGIGHNSAATKTDWADMLDPTAIRMDLSFQYEDLLMKQTKQLQAFENFLADHPQGVTSDRDVADATDLGAQVKALNKRFDTTRIAVKEPFYLADKTVQAFFKAPMEALDAAVKRIEVLITVYTKQKALAAQKAAQEAAKLAREEADRIAAAATTTMNSDLLDQAVIVEKEAGAAEKLAAKPIADFSRTRGDYAVSSGSVKYVFTVEDLSLVPLEYLMIDEAKIKRAINGKDRVGAIPGLLIEQDFSTKIRG